MTRFLLLTVFAISALSVQAQKAELTFGVSGLCGMCEDRIEAAFDQKGIVAADYDLEKKTIHVVYKTKKWDEERLHKLATGLVTTRTSTRRTTRCTPTSTGVASTEIPRLARTHVGKSTEQVQLGWSVRCGRSGFGAAFWRPSSKRASRQGVRGGDSRSVLAFAWGFCHVERR